MYGNFADNTCTHEYIYLGKPDSQQVKPPENQSRASVSESAMSSWSDGCPSSVKEKPKEPESNVPPRYVKSFDRFRMGTNQITLRAGKYFLRNTYAHSFKPFRISVTFGVVVGNLKLKCHYIKTSQCLQKG